MLPRRSGSRGFALKSVKSCSAPKQRRSGDFRQSDGENTKTRTPKAPDVKNFGCEYVVVCVIKHSVLYCLCYINHETKKILLRDSENFGGFIKPGLLSSVLSHGTHTSGKRHGAKPTAPV